MTWAAELAAWAIPQSILDQAPESPWGFPPKLFAAAPTPTDTPSRRHALAALPPSGGSVIDVGAGAGAASLALVPPAAFITAVDTSSTMLDAFEAAVTVPHRTVNGEWPAVATEVDAADVVVCHHVLYNVSDLVPFVSALTTSARSRVVCELTAVHPQVSLNALWRHFWDLDRPEGPTADDALAVIRDAGYKAQIERWSRPHRAQSSGASRAEVVAFARRRLCLTADRDAEVDALLAEDALMAQADVVTIWWDGAAGS